MQTGKPVPLAVPLGQQHGLPPELANTYWGQMMSAPPVIRDEDRVGRTGPRGQPALQKGVYTGGQMPPRPQELSPKMQEQLYITGGIGTTIGEEQGKELQRLGWIYGRAAPRGYAYDSNGVLQKKRGIWSQVGQVAGIAAPIIATIATAGAASPWLAASIAGAAGVAGAKLQGASWKNALITGAVSAGTAGLGAAPVGRTTQILGQAGINAGGTLAQGGSPTDALLAGGQAGLSTAVSTRPGRNTPPRRT
jgi:hypothetical protein